MLIVLDGFGYQPHNKYNAIAHAKTPHLNYFLEHYPHTVLKAAGTAVGLLPGTMGNSEVGHLTIGAGRVIEQPVTILHSMIQDGSFYTNPVLVKELQRTQQAGKKLHIMGLLSDAGVHSHIEDIMAFITAAVKQGITNIIVHPFLDGRDTPPRSAATYLEQLEQFLATIGHGIIGSLHGRFYAMDRDHNWERTRASYDVLTHPTTPRFIRWQDALRTAYSHGNTDEFVPPVLLHAQGVIQNGDSIIHANFRPDRARQLTECFVNPHFNQFPTKSLALTSFITPTEYGAGLQTHALLTPPIVLHTLKEELVSHGKSFFAIAETEKYAPVTYFFNGGKEATEELETRILIPSIPKHDYIHTPQMSAPEITQTVLNSLKNNPKDFYLINYANADMVGHSGNFGATVKAVECLDTQLGLLYNMVIEQMNGTLYITADHGNAENMYDPAHHQPHTSHTTNPVPFIMLTNELKDSNAVLPLTQLSDIAPFILKNLGLPIPKEMEKRQ